MKHYNRNLILLSACWFIFFAGSSMVGAEGESLCKAYEGWFKIGVGLNRLLPGDYRERELEVIRTQFNILTPANCMKMYHIQRQEGQFDFAQADAFVAFATANKQQVLGHCLIWAKDERTPEWFFKDGDNTAGRELLLKRIKTHIDAVVGRYRGRVKYWDVINEALADGTEVYRPSTYRDVIGEDFIAKTFEYARAADPEAMLIYNDYNLFFTSKQKNLKKLLEYFKTYKVPVDAVGIQGHFELDRIPYEELEKTIKLIQSCGLKMVVSELDIDVVTRSKWWSEGGKYRKELAMYDPYKDGCPPEVLQRQARQYSRLFELFSKYAPVIERVSFWDLHDGQSWLNDFPWKRVNHPLLFDREARPKPAYYTVLSVDHK